MAQLFIILLLVVTIIIKFVHILHTSPIESYAYDRFPPTSWFAVQFPDSKTVQLSTVTVSESSLIISPFEGRSVLYHVKNFQRIGTSPTQFGMKLVPPPGSHSPPRTAAYDKRGSTLTIDKMKYFLQQTATQLTDRLKPILGTVWKDTNNKLILRGTSVDWNGQHIGQVKYITDQSRAVIMSTTVGGKSTPVGYISIIDPNKPILRLGEKEFVLTK